MLVAGTETVWWTDCRGRLWRAPLLESLPTVAESGPVAAVAVDANSLYWVALDRRQLKQRHFDGTGERVMSGALVVLGRHVVSVDGSRAYFAALPASLDGSWEMSGVWATTIDGGEPVQLAVHEGTVDEVVADSSLIFWTEGDRIHRTAATAGASTILIQSFGGTSGMIARGQRLYFIGSHGSDSFSAIRSVSFDGFDARTHYQSACGIGALALDDQAFYLAECTKEGPSTSPRLRRIPRDL